MPRARAEEHGDVVKGKSNRITRRASAPGFSRRSGSYGLRVMELGRPGPGPPSLHHPGSSDHFTLMRRRFDVSPGGFGIVTSSTPSLNDAFI
jgi:hypothetical protein